jgi:hypothetical protein
MANAVNDAFDITTANTISGGNYLLLDVRCNKVNVVGCTFTINGTLGSSVYFMHGNNGINISNNTVNANHTSGTLRLVSIGILNGAPPAVSGSGSVNFNVPKICVASPNFTYAA